jgi:hypothetical protein
MVTDIDKSNVRMWVDENCLIGAAMATRFAALYGNYAEWATRHNRYVISKSALSRILSAMGFQKDTTTGNHKTFRGIGLPI